MHLSHVSFEDDIIIFTNGKIFVLHTLIGFLDRYEKYSGQKINHSKSSLYIFSWITQGCIDQIDRLTGFRKQEPRYLFGLLYLCGKEGSMLLIFSLFLTKSLLLLVVGNIIFLIWGDILF